MEFKEPDLEELIQNDLRTEISKILGQSEMEELEISAALSHDDSDSKQSPFESGNSRNSTSHTAVAVKGEPYHSEDEQQLVQAGFDVLNSSSIQDVSQHNQIPLGHHEISGHFAVGSYADFSREMGHYPVAVGEPNDLQSLTWLTTVDVHALQKLTEQGTVVTRDIIQSEQMNSIDHTVSSEETMPIQRSVIQTVSAAQMNANASISDSTCIEPSQNTHQSTSTSQYTPIHPPSISDERCYSANHQRYQIQPHQSGGPVGRSSYENSTHGSRRYMSLGHHHHHPYQPPPYNVNRSGYLHGGPFLHPRYHHHQSQQPKVYPKPVYSYSCLIAMALYNSKTGCLPVSEIYHFMMENYPYFKTAPDGWKNSVRHNLSLNKCFEKVEKPSGSQRKGCLWALNPAKIAKMKEEVQKWKRKDPESIRRSMSNPEELDRELEEMRRADDEAARRRMLSLTSHGLTAQSVHSHHQHPVHHPTAIQMHQQTSPSHMNSGTSSSLSSHQSGNHGRADLHFSTELAQQNFALTLAKSALQGSHDSTALYEHQFQNHHGLSNPSSQNLGCIPGSDAALSRRGSSADMIVLSAGGEKPSYFASPNSASPSSSNTSMLGTFTDCTAGFGGEEELDASFADLAVLHESFWNTPSSSHQSQCVDATDATESQVKSVMGGGTVTDEMPIASPRGHIRLPPVIRMLSSQSEQPSPDTPDYKPSSGQRVDNFGRDMSHFSNTSIKPVVMMQ